MPKGSNQKLKLSYLCKIMQEKTDDEHSLTLQQIMHELAEVKLLIQAIQSSKFITKNKSAQLINKMKSFVSEYQAKQIQRQFFVNDRIKNMNESIYYTVDTLHSAIEQNKQIPFQYCVWNTEKQLVQLKGY